MEHHQREMVYFICRYREEPLWNNTAKFNMLRYEDKHSLSLSQEIHLSIFEPEDRNIRAYKSKMDLRGELIFFWFSTWEINIVLIYLLSHLFKYHLSTITDFVVCLLEKSFVTFWVVTSEGVRENTDKWSQRGGGLKNAICSVTPIFNDP